MISVVHFEYFVILEYSYRLYGKFDKVRSHLKCTEMAIIMWM